MSEFCNQCMPEVQDMKGLTSPEDWAQGLAAIVLCEGCGAIQVDPEGNCLGDCKPYCDEDNPHKCPHCTDTEPCFFHKEVKK